jgi:dihydroflavonol-4-reductase
MTNPWKGSREVNGHFWAGKRACVTGGTGFLGYHLVRQLLDVGARVRVLALPPSAGHPLQNDRRTVNVFGDLRDPIAVRRALAGCHVVFNTACVVAFWGPALLRMREVSVQGAANVLEAAMPAARVVHTSSIVAVGASAAGEVLGEDADFNLDGVKVDYVHAKRAAEQLALVAAGRGQDVVVVNPCHLVGPEDHERSVMGRLCLRFWKGRVPLAPPGGINLVDVRDVARGHLLAAEHGRAGRRYILGGENHTLGGFLSLLADVAGYRPRALPRVPAWVLLALAELAEGWAWLTGREPCPSLQQARLQRFHWFYSSGRAERELGYRARPLVETLRDTWGWYAETGHVSLRALNRWWMRPGMARKERTAAREASGSIEPRTPRAAPEPKGGGPGWDRRLRRPSNKIGQRGV